MVFRCSPLFSFPVRFTPFSWGFEATAFRLSPLEYPQGQTRLPAKVPAPKADARLGALLCGTSGEYGLLKKDARPGRECVGCFSEWRCG